MMARIPARFRQADVTRALRAADAAGCQVRRVEITPEGRIVVIMAEPSEDEAELPLDTWRATRAAR
jgi:hypothetical protein